MAYEHYYLNGATQQDLQALHLIYTGIVQDEPDWFNIMHSHEFCELLYVVHGVGSLEIDGVVSKITEGDLIIINPNTLHKESSDPEFCLDLLFLAFDNFKIGDLAPNHVLPTGSNPIIKTKKHKYKIESYFSDLINETSTDIMFHKEISYHLLSLILFSAIRIFESEQDGEVSLHCKQIKDYIDENYTHPLTLDALSNNIYISKHYLSHIFKSEFGISPIKYLISKRIDKASKLLIETELTVAEISDMVGYDDSSYFSHLFKKSKKLSPLAFRKKYK